VVTRYLLDTNMLIALLWPQHTEQAKAVPWFKAKGEACFATCSFTQAGFLRITSSVDVMRQRFTVAEARQVLFLLAQKPGHAFWPTPISYFEATEPFEQRLHGPKQITDAYLLGIARHHGGKIATLDKGMKSLAGPGFSDLVELVE
jgi:toxin-antitoxin system PIN domain toxin